MTRLFDDEFLKQRSDCCFNEQLSISLLFVASELAVAGLFF
jgi:hypothetical protein